MASKRRERRKGCEGKIQYRTPKEAAVAAKEISEKHGGSRQNYYHCKFCGQYHTGHLPQKIRQIIKNRRAS